MTDLVNQPTTRTARKVKAAAIGAGGTAALTQPLAEIVARVSVEVACLDPQGFCVDLSAVEGQITMVAAGVFAGIGAWVTGYYTRERRENMLAV